VSARDPAARLFARYAASVADGLSSEGLPRNVWYAAALFEALAAYGINYVIDPASSFIEMSEVASALDSLNYPYQTLYYRGGDCDDLSILYCSMLEALGVDTAFITIPGHIYCAFDTGIETSAQGGGGKDEGEGWMVEGLVEYGGKLWMPVEITVPGEGFYRAWQIGAREWRRFEEQTVQAGGEERQIYPMRESWAVYPPVTVPGDRLPDLPEEREIVRRLKVEAEKIRRLNPQHE
jgi:hypothetical protein